MSDSPILHTIVWIINPAGGVGKTMVARVIEGISQMIGVDVALASQDRGNQALKHALDNAHLIKAESRTQDAVRIVSRVENREIFVIDVGANPSSSEYDPLPFGAALNAEITGRGGRMIAVVPTVPLKTYGSETAMRAAQDLLNEGLDVHVVKNHQDRSGNFGKLVLPDSVKVSELGHLPSGIMALAEEERGSLSDPYLTPVPGYRLAGGFIGRWLINASREPLMLSLFRGATSGLSVDPDRHPRPTFEVLDRKSQVTDEALLNNYAKFDAFERLRRARSDSELLTAAREFQRMCESWK